MDTRPVVNVGVLLGGPFAALLLPGSPLAALEGVVIEGMPLAMQARARLHQARRLALAGAALRKIEAASEAGQAEAGTARGRGGPDSGPAAREACLYSWY